MYVEPRFGKRPISTITTAEVREWTANLVDRGLAPSTVTRALATLRSVLQHAVDDGRLSHNVALTVRPPRGGARREGFGLTEAQIDALARACRGRYADLIPVLA